MPLRIVDYDAEWPVRYQRLAAAIQRALDPNALSIEHVGSTAVPGLEAKDVIDIQVSVASLGDEESYRRQLESLGYVYRPDHEQEHRFFKLDDNSGRRVAHVHVCQTGSRWERRHVAFRDYLLRHPDVAKSYAALKRSLASRFDDSNEYAEAKGPFIRELERKLPRSPTE